MFKMLKSITVKTVHLNRINNVKLNRYQFIRNGSSVSFENKQPPKKKSEVDDKFKMIYRLEEMHLISLASRAKTYQCGCALLITPLIAAGEFVHLVPQDTTLVAAILGFMTTIPLTVFSFLSKGTIGIIKYNEEESLLKVSSLNIWGEREDEIVPVDDWVPLSELPLGPTSKFFYTTRRYSTTQKMKLFCDSKYILDEKIFMSVIGVS